VLQCGIVWCRVIGVTLFSGVLQCVAVWCSVVQCGAVWCTGVVQCAATILKSCWSERRGRSSFWCVAVCCSVLQCVAMRCSVVQCGAAWCSVVQCGAVWCSVGVQCDADHTVPQHCTTLLCSGAM